MEMNYSNMVSVGNNGIVKVDTSRIKTASYLDKGNSRNH